MLIFLEAFGCLNLIVSLFVSLYVGLYLYFFTSKCFQNFDKVTVVTLFKNGIFIFPRYWWTVIPRLSAKIQDILHKEFSKVWHISMLMQVSRLDVISVLSQWLHKLKVDMYMETDGARIRSMVYLLCSSTAVETAYIWWPLPFLMVLPKTAVWSHLSLIGLHSFVWIFAFHLHHK